MQHRSYVHDIRWILHCWEKDEYGKAYALFYDYYKRTKGYIKKGEPVMENVIEGKLNYMRMVKGENNTTYRKLLERFLKLQGLVFVDTETDKGKSYIYVYSYPVSDFKKYFKTDLALEVSSKNKLVGKCQIEERDKVLEISKRTQEYLCKDISSKKTGEEIKTKLLNKCFVTLCRAKGKNFWLITKSEMKRSKCLSLLNANIDINKLLDIWEKQGVNEAAEALNYAVTEGKPILTDEERIADSIGLLDMYLSEKGNEKKPSKKKNGKLSITDHAIDFDIPANIEEILMSAETDDYEILSFDDFDDISNNIVQSKRLNNKE